MSDVVRERKIEVRKELIKRLRDQDPSSREERSKAIQDKLLSSEEFKGSKTIMSYVSLPTEVDTQHLNVKALETGKRVAVPYIDGNSRRMIAAELISLDQLGKGPFGILQPKDGFKRPISLKEIDLIVVPAIAYDKKNMRLGRGKGYYDRFLTEDHLSSSKSVGLAFHFQIMDFLPSDPHDKPVHRVITD